MHLQSTSQVVPKKHDFSALLHIPLEPNPQANGNSPTAYLKKYAWTLRAANANCHRSNISK